MKRSRRIALIHSDNGPSPILPALTQAGAAIQVYSIAVLQTVKAGEFDALCLDESVQSETPELRQILLDFYSQEKPIGAVGFSIFLISSLLGSEKVTLSAKPSAPYLRSEALFEECPANDYITDRDHRIITTPGSLYDATPAEVFQGLSGLAKELVEMA